MAQKPDNNRRPSQNQTNQNQGQSVALVVPKANEIYAKIKQHEPRIQQLIPHGYGSTLTAARILRQVQNALLEPGYRGNQLRACTPGSIANSVALAAGLALEINTPLGHAALIPYDGVCTFQPMYRGLITLALRGSRTHSVQSHVVMKDDDFRFRYGTSPLLEHTPAGNTTVIDVETDDWDFTYAIVRYRDVDKPEFLVLSRTQVEHIRNRSSNAYKYDLKKKGEAEEANKVFRPDSPWFTYPEEMIRKTPVKRLLKMLDLSPDLSRAVGLDDAAESRMPQEKVIEAVAYSEVDPEQQSAPRQIESAETDDDTGGEPPLDEEQDARQQPKASTKVIGPFARSDFEAGIYQAMLAMWPRYSADTRRNAKKLPANIAGFNAFLGGWQNDRDQLMEALKEANR